MRKHSVLALVVACLALAGLARPCAAEEMGGRFRLDLRAGPSFGLQDPAGYDTATGFDLQVDFGVRLFPHGEIFLAPGFHYCCQIVVNDVLVGTTTTSLVTVIVPVGFRSPWALGHRGFYVVPRVEIGYASSLSVVSGGDTDYTSFGYFTPAVAFEYELRHRWRFLIEPVNLPIYFNSFEVKVGYRVMAGVGMRFGR